MPKPPRSSGDSFAGEKEPARRAEEKVRAPEGVFGPRDEGLLRRLAAVMPLVGALQQERKVTDAERAELDRLLKSGDGAGAVREAERLIAAKGAGARLAEQVTTGAHSVLALVVRNIQTSLAFTRFCFTPSAEKKQVQAKLTATFEALEKKVREGAVSEAEVRELERGAKGLLGYENRPIADREERLKLCADLEASAERLLQQVAPSRG